MICLAYCLAHSTTFLPTVLLKLAMDGMENSGPKPQMHVLKAHRLLCGRGRMGPEPQAPGPELKTGKRQRFPACWEPWPGRPHSLVEVGLLGHLLTPLQGVGVLVLQALQV